MIIQPVPYTLSTPSIESWPLQFRDKDDMWDSEKCHKGRGECCSLLMQRGASGAAALEPKHRDSRVPSQQAASRLLGLHGTNPLALFSQCLAFFHETTIRPLQRWLWGEWKWMLRYLSFWLPSNKSWEISMWELWTFASAHTVQIPQVSEGLKFPLVSSWHLLQA